MTAETPVLATQKLERIDHAASELFAPTTYEAVLRASRGEGCFSDCREVDNGIDATRSFRLIYDIKTKAPGVIEERSIKFSIAGNQTVSFERNLRYGGGCDKQGGSPYFMSVIQNGVCYTFQYKSDGCCLNQISGDSPSDLNAQDLWNSYGPDLLNNPIWNVRDELLTSSLEEISTREVF